MFILLIPTKLFMIVANFDSVDRKHIRRLDFTIKNQDSLVAVDNIYSLCAGNLAILCKV